MVNSLAINDHGAQVENYRKKKAEISGIYVQAECYALSKHPDERQIPEVNLV